MKRQYIEEKHGAARWLFWRWRIIPVNGADYMKRLYVFRTPLLSAMINFGSQADGDRFPHDHPWWFVSFILRGWYVEEVAERWMGDSLTTAYGVGDVWTEDYRCIDWVNIKRPTELHRIVHVSPGGFTSLVFTGPKVRSWGFQTNNGWVHWKQYLQNKQEMS